MPSAPPLPAPSHILRSHSTPLTCVSFSNDNERLYSGDASGLVVITSARSLRAIASWQPHTGGLLGIEEWEDRIMTHGRDNKLNVWTQIRDPTASTSIRLGGSATVSGLSPPQLCYSMDVNALNFCRFSLMRLPDSGRASGSGARNESRALIALPNLVESSLADVWELPSRERLHAAIGKVDVNSAPEQMLSSDARGSSKRGLIMSLHLFIRTSSSENILQLLCAFENGSVALFRFESSDKHTAVEGIGWETIWDVKLHVEAVMAMTVSKDSQLALTVSADNLIGRYNLNHHSNPSVENACVAYRTKHPGNSAIAVRDDGRVCAVGGWDGKVRLYSTKKLKPLGTLDCHKDGCQAVAFANQSTIEMEAASVLRSSVMDEESDEDDISQDEKVTRGRWLIAGGKDHRVSIWTLIDFGEKEKNVQS